MSRLRQAQESPSMSPSLPPHHQQQQQQRSGSRSQRSLMDLRNLCQRLDVDSLKAKLPAMPQLKLPKSLPRSLPKSLHGARRILRRSKSGGAGSTSGAVAGVATGAVTVAAGVAAVPHAQYINRTPQRISTISSLMHEAGGGGGGGAGAGGTGGQLQATYCSAGSLDDDYYAPYGGTARASRPISPIKMPPPLAPPSAAAAAAAPPTAAAGSALTQRLQRGYKTLSELRFKHIFAKQTTVRRDNIEVQRYVEQYEAERRVEEQVQAQRDRQIADNYRIHISTLPISRQNTLQEEEEQEKEEEQQQPEKHAASAKLAEHSGDESGLETPVAVQKKKQKEKAKKPGIAATRFAKVRQPPLPMPVEEQVAAVEQVERQPMRQAVRQNLKRLRKSIKRVSLPQETSSRAKREHDSEEEEEQHRQHGGQVELRGGTLRARLRRFTSSEQLQQRWRKSFKSGGQEQEQSATAQGAGAAAGAALGLGMGAQLERTMAKLNEKMQQLKFFPGRNSSCANAQLEQNKPNTVGREPNEIDDDDELEATYHHSDSSEDSDDSGQQIRAEDAFDEQEENVEQVQVIPARSAALLAQLHSASTAWSSESLEEDEQTAQPKLHSDYPRVLIHQQQHTDAYESTLIIAMATTPSPEPREAAWLPNEQIIAGFKQQQQLQWPAPSLYKAKSIDIFECEGGAAAAFADFDEALRNAPVLRISDGTSSGDDEADDSSSHATRIRLQLTPQMGNSCESLMEQQEPLEYDKEEELAVQQECRELPPLPDAERPPSVSPPPPPLPQRRPPLPPSAASPIYDMVPPLPPLPVGKPPPAMAAPVLPAAPANPPAPSPSLPAPAPTPALARLTQRSASMTRPSKPLVKTSSLRLTYNEQVHPGDIGKVNKLITRFEGGRPRLCASRRLTHSEELTTCSDEDDEPQAEPEPEQATPTNIKREIPHIVTTTQAGNNNNNEDQPEQPEQGREQTQERISELQQLSLDRQNSNCSRSEYGSPLAYPMRRSATPTIGNVTAVGTRVGTGAGTGTVTESGIRNGTGVGTGTGTGTGTRVGTRTGTGTARILSPLQPQPRHSRRSMTRDDDNFYSFDSDEENSYYSISPSSSSRYVVEI